MVKYPRMSHSCHPDSKIKGIKVIIHNDAGALTGPTHKFKSSPRRKKGCTDFLIIQSTSGVSRLAAITLAAVWESREIQSMVHGFDTLADGDPSYKTSLTFLTNKEAA